MTQGFKLVDEKGNEVKIGAILTDFRGDKALLTGFTPPRHEASTGRVHVKADSGKGYDASYYPSVYDLEIVPV